MSDNENRALARLVDELHRRPESERARLLEGCRRDLERERQLLEGLDSPDAGEMDGALADMRHALRSVRSEGLDDETADAIADIRHPSRSTKTDTRTRDDLEAEALAERALATPMRIQDLMRDAQPQEWQAMGAGGFIATPTPDSTLIVGQRSSGVWQWSVHINELNVSTVGTATSPARAVAAAEAVYHLTGQR